MKSYTVHRRRRTLGNPEAEADSTVFVREGFAWVALFVPVLWAIYHRLWLSLFGFVLIAGIVNLVISATGFPDFVNAVASAAIQVLFAAEANDLRRWTLARRGFDMTAVIVAKDQNEAETRYFRSWCETINAHQAAHAAGDNVEISFRTQADAPAAPAPVAESEKPA